MTSTIKLVATDLDGTLLRPDGTVSERTRATLRRVEDRGVPVVAVSGRSPRSAQYFAEGAGIRGLVICCNGALVYDMEHDAIVEHFPIAADVARALVTRIRAALPGACFAAEIGLRHGREPAYAALPRSNAFAVSPERTEDRIECDALELCETGITKLIVRHPEHGGEALASALGDVVGVDAVIGYPGGPFVEISATGVHKAAALEALARDLGVAREHVLAFGDMPNDLPMLTWAGRAVAVANAHPAVLAAVHEVTASNVDDGVAVALERLVLSS